MRALGFLGLVFLISLGLRAWCFESFKMPGEAMQPVLLPGDLIFVLKSAVVGPPNRGSIVVFTPSDDPDSVLVRRVVGLAGERIELRTDGLYVQGVRIPGAQGDRGELQPFPEIQLNPNEVFVMPDFRTPSAANRVGAERIGVAQILGEARWVWFSTRERNRWFKRI